MQICFITLMQEIIEKQAKTLQYFIQSLSVISFNTFLLCFFNNEIHQSLQKQLNSTSFKFADLHYFQMLIEEIYKYSEQNFLEDSLSQAQICCARLRCEFDRIKLSSERCPTPYLLDFLAKAIYANRKFFLNNHWIQGRSKRMLNIIIQETQLLIYDLGRSQFLCYNCRRRSKRYAYFDQFVDQLKKLRKAKRLRRQFIDTLKVIKQLLKFYVRKLKCREIQFQKDQFDFAFDFDFGIGSDSQQ